MTRYRDMLPEQRKAYLAKVNESHFRLHGYEKADRVTTQRGNGKPRPAARTICDKWTKKSNTKELRLDATVDCINCMVIKDVWLDQEKRRPLTVRRWGALIDEKFGGSAPNVQPAKPIPTPEEVQARRDARAEKEALDRLDVANANLLLREKQLARLITRSKRIATAIKKAQRRVRLAEKKLASFDGGSDVARAAAEASS